MYQAVIRQPLQWRSEFSANLVHVFLWETKTHKKEFWSYLFEFACNVCLPLICFWRDSPKWARPSSFTRSLDHTQRRTTFGRTSLDESSTRRRDLYLTTHVTHNRQISNPPVGFEPTISAGERSQTYRLDRAATGIGSSIN